jgi:hypothetical protein
MLKSYVDNLEQKVKTAIEDSQLTIADEIKSRRFELFAAKKPHSYFDAVVDFERTNGWYARRTGSKTNSPKMDRLLEMINDKNEFDLREVLLVNDVLNGDYLHFNINSSDFYSQNIFLYDNEFIEELDEERK